jgi:hypothetical protein
MTTDERTRDLLRQYKAQFLRTTDMTWHSHGRKPGADRVDRRARNKPKRRRARARMREALR